MKRIFFGGFPAAALAAFFAGVNSPASAAIVYVSYTGTVSEGEDMTGLFGAPGADLAGEAYTSNYVFDTNTPGACSISLADRNFVVGGTGSPGCGSSPSRGATITINGVSASFNGDFYGWIYGRDDGGLSGVEHEVQDRYEDTRFKVHNSMEHDIYNEASTLPLDITTPFSHTVTPGVDDASGFFSFYTFDTSINTQVVFTFGYLTPETFTISNTAAPVPGSMANAPLLPIADATPQSFDFNFPVVPGQQVFIDPLIAIGYDYVVTSGPNIASVLLPTILSDDGLYQIYLWDGDSFDLFGGDATAGIAFDFGPGGVDRFRVLGIDQAAMLDPDLDTAFVTGLTFVGSGTVVMSQTPVTFDAVPEPMTLSLLGAGLAGIGWARRRRSLPLRGSAIAYEHRSFPSPLVGEGQDEGCARLCA